MKNIMAVFVAFALLSVASIATAATTTPRKIGYEDDGNWTYSTDLSYDGSCSTGEYYCKEYYAPLQICDADGVYARADTDTDYYYFNAFYSTNAGNDWVTYVDSEGCSYVYGVWPNPGYYLCHGTEQEGYNNWDAPGNTAKVPFMAFNYKYQSAGIMNRVEFLSKSCVWLD
jgi:hypothetical protein